MFTHCDICKNELDKIKTKQYSRNGIKKNVCRSCYNRNVSIRQKAKREAKKLNK